MEREEAEEAQATSIGPGLDRGSIPGAKSGSKKVDFSANQSFCDKTSGRSASDEGRIEVRQPSSRLVMMRTY